MLTNVFISVVLFPCSNLTKPTVLVLYCPGGAITVLVEWCCFNS
uniref:NCA protein n=1 Tax=Homo sapiens TaxID=9606 RepID=Q14922_HUMAN|nr:ORF2 [Homo sapiens]